MGAEFARLFEDVDIFGRKRGRFFCFAVFFDEIGEMKSAGKTGGSRANDQNIRVQPFTLDCHARILAERKIGRATLTMTTQGQKPRHHALKERLYSEDERCG